MDALYHTLVRIRRYAQPFKVGLIPFKPGIIIGGWVVN